MAKMQIPIIPKSCHRCDGATFIEKEETGNYRNCINCGYVIYYPEIYKIKKEYRKSMGKTEDEIAKLTVTINKLVDEINQLKFSLIKINADFSKMAHTCF